MSTLDRYRYVADVYSLDGEPVGQLPITPDWDAAVQWAHFHAVRRGRAAPLTRGSSAIIEPVWDREHGEPRVEGFTVTLQDGDAAPSIRAVDRSVAAADELAHNHGHSDERNRITVPRIYLRGAVERAAMRLVHEGKLADGQSFLYELAAFRAGVPAPAAAPGQTTAAAPEPRSGMGAESFTAEEVPQTLPLGTASLADHIAEASYRGAGEGPGDEMPLFIPARVIAEAKELARRQPDIETGGLLIGRLYRDTASPEVFAEITAFVPARHTIADRSRLTFTADTWAAARAALDLRGGDELLAGWLHAHPWWCRGCPPERRRLCPLMQPFFSRDDIALHRTVFPAGFHVALLLTDLGEPDLRVDAFGWRQGMVTSRGYYVTGARPSLEVESAAEAPTADSAARAGSPARTEGAKASAEAGERRASKACPERNVSTVTPLPATSSGLPNGPGHGEPTAAGRPDRTSSESAVPTTLGSPQPCRPAPGSTRRAISNQPNRPASDHPDGSDSASAETVGSGRPEPTGSGRREPDGPGRPTRSRLETDTAEHGPPAPAQPTERGRGKRRTTSDEEPAR